MNVFKCLGYLCLRTQQRNACETTYFCTSLSFYFYLQANQYCAIYLRSDLFFFLFWKAMLKIARSRWHTKTFSFVQALFLYYWLSRLVIADECAAWSTNASSFPDDIYTHSSALAWRIPRTTVHGVSTSGTRLSDFHFTSLHLSFVPRHRVRCGCLPLCTPTLKIPMKTRVGLIILCSWISWFLFLLFAHEWDQHCQSSSFPSARWGNATWEMSNDSPKGPRAVGAPISDFVGLTPSTMHPFIPQRFPSAHLKSTPPVIHILYSKCLASL